MARARRAAACRRLEDRSPEQGHVAESADRRRAAERSRALRARRADDRARSGQRQARAGSPARAPPQRTHDDSLDPSDEPGRSAVRPDRDDQPGTADGVRRGRRGASPPFAARSSGSRPRSAAPGAGGGERHRRWGGVVAADAGGRAVRRRTRCRRSWGPARSSTGSSRCSHRWKTSFFASCGKGRRGDEDGLAQDLDDRDLRVPDRGPASRLPDHDLRDAALHGGVRRGRGDPGLLRQPQRARAGGLWRRRSRQRAAAAERSPIGVAAAARGSEARARRRWRGVRPSTARCMQSNSVFRPYAADADARSALAARTIKGYFVVPPDYIASGVVDVYTQDTFNISGRRVAERVLEPDPGAAGDRPAGRADDRPRGEPAQGDAAVQRDEERRDHRRRPGGRGRALRRAAHLHGALPDVRADDVGLPDAGHRDREGEQGRRRAARVGRTR